MRFSSKLSCFVILTALWVSCDTPSATYICPPCDLPCDELSFSRPGQCPHCKMQLISQKEWEKEQNLIVNDVNLEKGSSVFLVEGNLAPVKIYYHMPEHFSPKSKILMVIPGSGRDGDEYRDAWIEASEKYNILILSPQYREEDYGFAAYHLGGLVKELNLSSAVTDVPNTNQVRLDEDSLSYLVNANTATWLFNDFDRIFDRVVAATNSSQKSYDLFGHSAGGQILHRLAIFYPHTKATTIISANSGFYTLPDFSLKLPFGLSDSPMKPENLKNSFAKDLVILIGALDNEKEQGGIMLRSVTADQQGIHRLARGKYFFEKAKARADSLNYPFHWRLKIVPEVGHDHKKMSAAAAELLYE